MGKPHGLRRRLRITVLVGAALAVGSIGVPGASAGELQPICHRTFSSQNPYVVNTPNNSGQVEGHLDHTGPVWTPGATPPWGDIIPPQPGAPNGLNWTAEGMAIHANNCVPPDLPPPPPPPPPPPDGGGPGDPGTTATPTQPGTPGRPAPAVVGQPRTTG